MLRLIFYFLIGMLQAYISVRQWKHAARNKALKAFMGSIFKGIVLYLTYRLAFDEDVLTYSIFSVGYALGVTLGIRRNHNGRKKRKKEIESK